MKKVCLLLAVLLLVYPLAMPALAAPASAPLHIASNTYYDPVEKAFLYYVNGNASQAVRSNAADGMITAQAVSVRADAGVPLEVYLNGEQ